MSKRSPTEKPRPLALDHLPDDLGGNYYSFDRLKLLSSDGKAILLYNNTGASILGNVLEKETQSLKSTSQVVQVHHSPPYLYLFYVDDSIQVVNTEEGSCERYQHEKDTVKKIQCVLSNDTTIYGITSSAVFIWNKTFMRDRPRTIAIKDSMNEETRIIINVNKNYSSLISPTRILLGNSDVFQIWELENDKMHLVFEGRNANETVKYFGVYYQNGHTTIVTTSRDTFLVWNFAFPKVAAVNPKEVKTDSLVTSVYLDDAFIITGTASGTLSLYSRGTGEKFYDLNRGIEVQGTNGSLLDFDVEHKINSIEKWGRWIFVGFEDSRMSVFDITKERADPVLEYLHPKGDAVSQVRAHRDCAFFVTKKKHLSKKGSEKKKPDVFLWVFPPQKVPGLDYYFDKLNSREPVRTIPLLLGYGSSLIGGYLQTIEKAGEDVTEFTSIIERVDEVIKQLNRNPEVCSFAKLAPLCRALDGYADLLGQLTQTGRLMRFFTSSRLRSKIEIQNSNLHSKLNEVEPVIKTILREQERRRRETQSTKMLRASQSNENIYSVLRPSTPSTSRKQPPEVSTSPQNQNQMTRTRSFTPEGFVERESMIGDPSARTWWRNCFGHGLMIEWNEFAKEMMKVFKDFTAAEAKQMQGILDNGNTGFVSQYKFSEFLKGFGPFEKCVANMKGILSKQYFHGFLSSRESDLLMMNAGAPDGTFLVRFSKSKPGSFALAFIKDGRVRHILVESNMPEGFRISEQDTSGNTRVFASLDEIISHYKFVLMYPFTTTITQAPWFHGDLSTEEANEVMNDKRNGTFLVRFSSRGCFAASFVDSQSVIRHVLINSNQGRTFTVDTGELNNLSFADLYELIAYYQAKSIFRYPLMNNQSNLNM